MTYDFSCLQDKDFVIVVFLTWVWLFVFIEAATSDYAKTKTRKWEHHWDNFWFSLVVPAIILGMVIIHW